MHSCIGHLNTDSSKTDDTQFLSGNLASGKLFFLFLGHFSDIVFVFILTHPFDTAYDIAGSQKHTGNDHLLNTVGIRARCIKYNDTFLRAGIQRNIIDTGTGSGYTYQIFRKLQLMHAGASHQHCLGFIQSSYFFVFFRKMSGSYGRNGI